MSEPKWTPEPWYADDGEGFSVWSIRGARPVHGGGPVLAQVIGDSAETEANANLIEAAPDLYKELSHLAELIRPYLGQAVPGLATLNGADAALAKARGEKP